MWWARQDSNLQPDRYERQGIDEVRWFRRNFIRFRGVTLYFVHQIEQASAEIIVNSRATHVSTRLASFNQGLR